jgi:hypothetical protein
VSSFAVLRNRLHDGPLHPDKSGLIYAHSGNKGFDPSQYKTFRADDDGIVLLLERDWGIRDDAVNRMLEFISVAWPKEHLEVNLKFIADSLGIANGEQPRRRAWLVVTSQEDMDAVLGDMSRTKKQDFSKIQGRLSFFISEEGVIFPAAADERFLFETAQALLNMTA